MKYEFRIMSSFLSSSGKIQNKAGKFLLNLSSLLLATCKPNKCQLEMTNNKIKLNYLQAFPNVQIKTYLQVRFLILISQTHGS